MTENALVRRGSVEFEVSTRAERRVALEQLAKEAAETDSPEEAQRIMLQTRVIADALKLAEGTHEDAWLAAKTSVTACRRLGIILERLSTYKTRLPGRGGTSPSARGLIMRRLGLTPARAHDLRRLARMPDEDFQRYIQQRDNTFPTLNGALRAAGKKDYSGGGGGHFSAQRRRKAGVRTPANPSFDEGYSLIVRALGHLSAEAGSGSNKRRAAVSAALDRLYDAEELLKPYRGGYVS